MYMKIFLTYQIALIVTILLLPFGINGAKGRDMAMLI